MHEKGGTAVGEVADEGGSSTTGAPRRSSWIRRGLPWLLLFVLLGGGGGFAASRILPKTYTATAGVLVNPLPADQSTSASSARAGGTVNLDTEAQVVTSVPVAKRARRLAPELANRPVQKLIEDVVVSVPPNSTVMDIEFSARSATLAQDGANAFASAYLADRSTVEQGVVKAEMTAAGRRTDAITSQLQAVTDQLHSVPSSSGQYAFYSALKQLLVGQLSDLNAQLLQWQTLPVDPGRVLRPARRPTAASSPSVVLDTASGVGAGLVLGALAAWLASRLRRVVRRPEDLAGAVDVPLLATVSNVDVSAGDWRRTAAAEACRRLAVVAESTVTTPAAVLVVSADRSPAATGIAAGLAGALADDGAAVRLLHFGRRVAPIAQSAPFLTSVDDLEALRHIAPASSLHGRLLAVRGDDDYLVTDLSEGARGADPQRLGRLVDAVVVVATARTRLRDVRALVASLDDVGAPLLGTVFVKSVQAWKAAQQSRAAGKHERDRATLEV